MTLLKNSGHLVKANGHLVRQYTQADLEAMDLSIEISGLTTLCACWRTTGNYATTTDYQINGTFTLPYFGTSGNWIQWTGTGLVTNGYTIEGHDLSDCSDAVTFTSINDISIAVEYDFVHKRILRIAMNHGHFFGTPAYNSDPDKDYANGKCFGETISSVITACATAQGDTAQPAGAQTKSSAYGGTAIVIPICP